MTAALQNRCQISFRLVLHKFNFFKHERNSSKEQKFDWKWREKVKYDANGFCCVYCDSAEELWAAQDEIINF